MKLYFTPGACSLADHIAMHEAGLAFDRIRVDLETKRTEDGGDYTKVNPKGYVPALVLDDGQLLTENIAILSWVADRDPKLAPDGELGRIRLIEMLAFLSTELHKQFGRFFFPTSDVEKQAAQAAIRKWLDFVAARLRGDYLFGNEFSVADAYLFVMLRWARMRGLDLPEPLPAFVERMNARPAVQLALQTKGWLEGAACFRPRSGHPPRGELTCSR